jgi:hypothetical protein
MDKKETTNTIVDELSQLIAASISSYVSSIKNHTTVSMDDILQALMKTYNGILINSYTSLLEKKLNALNNGKPTENKDK